MLDEFSELGERRSTAEAAAYLGVTENTMARWREVGDGPKYQQMGGRFFYYDKWLIEYMRATIVTPGEMKP